MYYIGVRDGKVEKEGITLSQHLGFLSHEIYLAPLKVYTKLGDRLSWEPKILWLEFLLERKKNGQIREW